MSFSVVTTLRMSKTKRAQGLRLATALTLRRSSTTSSGAVEVIGVAEDKDRPTHEVGAAAGAVGRQAGVEAGAAGVGRNQGKLSPLRIPPLPPLLPTPLQGQRREVRIAPVLILRLKLKSSL